MKQIIRLFVLPLLAWAAAACGSSDSFSISGTIEGKPNMNIYIKYYGNNKVASGIARVADGDFEISGSSRQPTLVEVADNEGRPLAYLYLKDGQQASVRIDRSSPFRTQAKGTPVVEEWSALARSLADSLAAATPAQANALVEARIASHPASIASAILFLTAYHAELAPERADSVAQSLLPEARPNGLLNSYSTLTAPYASGGYLRAVDSIPYRTLNSRQYQAFIPSEHKASLIAITDNDSKYRLHRNDTVVPALRRLHGERPSLYIFDLSVATDTNAWKSAVRTDTATWAQGWAPGGLLARGIDHLALPTLPYYLVLDSAGLQQYRGPSLDDAITSAKAAAPKK